MEFKPEDVLRNRIHFSALLTSGDDVSVTVTVGGVDIAGAAFTRKPDGGVGVYQYVFPFPFLKPSNCLGRGYLTKVSSNPNLCQWKRRYKHLIGPVVVTMNRAGTIIGTVSGGPGITRECEQGVQNFNAWVGVDEGKEVAAKEASLPLREQVCVRGDGPGDFLNICMFTCELGFWYVRVF